MKLYSVMPLDMTHMDEICEDIREQYEKGAANRFLFEMTLVPEGDPPVNKAALMSAQYVHFRERLSSMGIPSGALVQASIGHGSGWKLSEMFPFQRLITRRGEQEVVCPYDEGFRKYIRDAMRTIASAKPDFIMLDDDFRLLQRDFGCTCPLHVSRVNELAGTDLSREELLEAINSDTEEGRRICAVYIETQKESLVDCAREMRAGIDEVDRRLPGSYCCVGNNAEFAAEIGAILAGEGNPVIVRINNGHYAAPGPRFLSTAFFRAAAQIAKLKGKADFILAETDTCRQNRYATSAAQLHAHFTGTILEGARGAKHWITRLNAFEPQSGTAYREKLYRYRKFYEALEELVPELRWRGFRIPVLDRAVFSPKASDDGALDFYSEWGRSVLERLGLPMYFSAESGGILCLEGDADKLYTDEEILEFFKGPVLLASDTAQRLSRRGFGKYLGVEAREWKGRAPSVERLCVNSNETFVQKGVKELVPIHERVVEDSTVYHTVDRENYERLFPGTTIFENELGGISFVFSGTPRSDYNIFEIFSFLNFSRKRQLVAMLDRTDEGGVYYPNDEEMYLRAADMKNGDIFCALFNIGLDKIEETQLVCKKSIEKIEKLMPDGTRRALAFTASENRYTVRTACDVLDPLILFLHPKGS